MKSLFNRILNAFFTVNITKRFYIVVLSLFVLPLVFLLAYECNQLIKEQKLERQAQLLLVAAHLREAMPGSFTEILQDYDALDSPPEEQVLILNQVFQPIIDSVNHLYPSFGIGYYDIQLDSVVAIGPEFTRSMLITVPRCYPYFECYQSGMPEFGESGTSIGWGGDAIIYVTYPIYWDSEIVGHTWANVRMNDIYGEVKEKTKKYIFTMLLIALTVALIIWVLFRNFSRELRLIAQSINEDIQALKKDSRK